MIAIALFSQPMLLHAAEDHAERFGSINGLFQVKVGSELNPIVINRMHSWTLMITTAEQTPVLDAEVTVTGGMPEHDHGLATRPRITAGIVAGSYRVDGMRFHMGGSWQLTFTIKAADGTDTVLIPLEL